MAVQFKSSGVPLFSAPGVVAMDPACCCEPIPCCTWESDRALYLTIDEFSIDGGGSCDGGCTGFGVTSKLCFGGTTGSPALTTWFTETCGDDGDSVVAYTLLCNDGTCGPSGSFRLNMFSGGISWIVDDCELGTKICVIKLHYDAEAPCFSDQNLGYPVSCDPFYLIADVAIDIYASDGTTLCGTGSMRVTINE